MPDQLAAPVQSDLSPTNSLSAGYEGVQLPAVVLLDNVRSMYNVGAFFRAADGVSLEKLFLCGITAHPPKKAISKTALGAEGVVPWEHDWDAVGAAVGLRNKGYETLLSRPARIRWICFSGNLSFRSVSRSDTK